MYPEDQGILAQKKKPSGPISNAVAATGIAALMPTDPDTDGRRQYSPGYSAAFDNRLQAERPATTGIASPVNGVANPAPPIADMPGTGIAAPAQARANRGAGIAAIPQPGRDANGTITAESAQAAMGNDMQRSGGVFGIADMSGANDILARENKARGEMIDLSIKANGGNGIAILPDYQPPQQGGMSISDLQSAMKSAGTRTERAAYGQALQTMLSGQNQAGIEQIRQQGGIDQRGIMAGIEQAKQAGQDQRAADRNQVQMRGQDLQAETAADRMTNQRVIAEQRTAEVGSRLTLPQRRANSEIDAARERIAGMDPAEIKRRTANYTATGRENPDFDPTLAKSVSLANRRKYGADDQFDQGQPERQSAGTDGDVMARFRSDRSMLGRKTGQMTDQGLEVFDAEGRLIGHYQ